MDLLERRAVDKGLAAPQKLEGSEGASQHARGETSSLQHAPDLREVAMRLRLLGADLEEKGIEAVALHDGRPQRDARKRERAEAPLDLGEWGAERHERAQDHVAARAADQVEVDDAHAQLPDRDRSAITPAA